MNVILAILIIFLTFFFILVAFIVNMVMNHVNKEDDHNDKTKVCNMNWIELRDHNELINRGKKGKDVLPNVDNSELRDIYPM
jgi:preprotein translocase subunit SecG